MKYLTPVLLVATLLTLVGFIFANQLPGAWWQWLAVAVLLFLSAAGAAVAAEDEKK